MPKEGLLLLRSLRRVAVELVLLVVFDFPLFGAVYDISLQGLTDRFSEGFDFSGSHRSNSSTGRIEQYVALTSGWVKSPLMGKGLGASATSSIRSEVFPWSYELYHAALLFQTGPLGVAAYAAGIGWMHWLGIRIIKQGGTNGRFIVIVLVGTSGFLVAAGTNPYLARCDGIWVIFLPLAFINHWLLAHDQAHKSSPAVGRQLDEPF